MSRSRNLLIGLGAAVVLAAGAGAGLWIAKPFKESPAVAAAKPISFSLLDQNGRLMTEAN